MLENQQHPFRTPSYIGDGEWVYALEEDIKTRFERLNGELCTPHVVHAAVEIRRRFSYDLEVRRVILTEHERMEEMLLQEAVTGHERELHEVEYAIFKQVRFVRLVLDRLIRLTPAGQLRELV